MSVNNCHCSLEGTSQNPQGQQQPPKSSQLRRAQNPGLGTSLWIGPSSLTQGQGLNPPRGLPVDWGPGSACSFSHRPTAHGGGSPEPGQAAEHREAPLNLSRPDLTTVPSLLQWFRYVEVPGNHYVHINQPDHVDKVISSFLKSEDRLSAQL